MLQPYLDDLERRIDDDEESALYAHWRNFVDGHYSGDIFSPRRSSISAPGIDWPPYRVNAAIEDIEMMLIQQYGLCSDILSGQNDGVLSMGNGYLLCVRANYGTSIIPSLFGVELFTMTEEHNTLPTSWPIAGGKDAIKRLLDQGVPDIYQSLGGKVFRAGERFVQIADRYPGIGQHVHIYHPDLQSPMDLCEVLWGSSLFLDTVDEPELVKEFLALITETYLVFLRAWDTLVAAPTDGYAVHWGFLQKGHIMLRDDSAMNFSPDMYREFIMPYDQRLLDAFGGGAMHFCGKGDHYLPHACSLPGMTAINLSQPEYNDMEAIYQTTVDKGIQLLGLQRKTAEDAIARGRSLRGCVHCG